jgi:threonine dehydrogenase-like Zn-dependent dehydrogenase
MKSCLRTFLSLSGMVHNVNARSGRDAAMARRRIDVRPLLTEIVPLADAVRAFDLATDRSRAMKVLLAF